MLTCFVWGGDLRVSCCRCFACLTDSMYTHSFLFVGCCCVCVFVLVWLVLVVLIMFVLVLIRDVVPPRVL